MVDCAVISNLWLSLCSVCILVWLLLLWKIVWNVHNKNMQNRQLKNTHTQTKQQNIKTFKTSQRTQMHYKITIAHMKTPAW